jgi:RNA 3'-terminal phosphate cyclase (ATP)
MAKPIKIDGSSGGGQLLRSALSLSLVTGQSFHMTNIRGSRRPKPGLMRQHLTCVQSAQTVGDAVTDGAELGSLELIFSPGKIRPGDYHFAIGSGGSTSLVLQTLLPALWSGSAPSSVVIEGGTHNPMAPPFDFLARCYQPQLQRMGVAIELELEQHGFMQAGGGRVKAKVQPVQKWQALALTQRGEEMCRSVQVISAHLPSEIPQRILHGANRELSWPAEACTISEVVSSGPGAALMIAVEFAQVTELSTSIAQMGRTAEAVATRAAKGMNSYLASAAPAGVHLADQLLLPMALSGGGLMHTLPLSDHSRTNMALIAQFLPVQWQVSDLGHGVCEVRL